jgi:hypothetical protein
MAQGLEIATRPTAEDVQVAADELMHRYDVKKIDLPLMREVVERELQSQLRLPPSKRNNQTSQPSTRSNAGEGRTR